MSSSNKLVIPQDVDGNEQLWGNQVANVNGATGLDLIGAVASVKHRVFSMQIWSDTAGLVVLSDGLGSFYVTANGMTPIDFGTIGVKQGTVNTAITMTLAGADLSGVAIYKADA